MYRHLLLITGEGQNTLVEELSPILQKERFSCYSKYMNSYALQMAKLAFLISSQKLTKEAWELLPLRKYYCNLTVSVVKEKKWKCRELSSEQIIHLEFPLSYVIFFNWKSRVIAQQVVTCIIAIPL